MSGRNSARAREVLYFYSTGEIKVLCGTHSGVLAVGLSPMLGLVSFGCLRVCLKLRQGFCVDAFLNNEREERHHAAKRHDDKLGDAPAHEQPNTNAGEQINNVEPAVNNEHPRGNVYSAGEVAGFAVKDAERYIGTSCGVFCTRHQVIAHPVVGNHLNHQQQ